MGYGIYEIGGMKRGYSVFCKCMKRGCKAKIHRGVAYLCGECTRYFCRKHLTIASDVDDKALTVECFAGKVSEFCQKCAVILERRDRQERRFWRNYRNYRNERPRRNS